MAFSKELEAIIEAALADGVITEKERAVLHKKALQEGVDPDEVDVVIDGRLQQMQNEVNNAKQKVRKCPSCGEIIPAMTAVCPSCGQVIDTSNPDNKALATYMDKLESSLVKLKKNGASKYNNKVKAELEGMVRQGKAMYGSNKKIAFLISEVEDSIAKFDKAHKNNFIMKIICGVIVILAIGCFCLYCSHQEDSLNAQIEAEYHRVMNEIDALPVPSSANYDECVLALNRIAWKKVSTEYNRHEDDLAEGAVQRIEQYVNILHGIEPEYIDKHGNKVSEHYLGRDENKKNPKYYKFYDLIYKRGWGF